MDEKELEEELRKRSAFYELGYQIEQFKNTLRSEFEKLFKFILK